MKIAGSGSGSISQKYGSADPDQYHNFMDPQHCKKYWDKRIKKLSNGSVMIPDG
jgi:hypothetical protein